MFTTLCLSYVWSIEQLIAIQLIGSLTGSAGGSVFSALLAEVLKEHRGESLGKYNAFVVVGGFLGNIISGILYNTIGFRNMLRLIAALNFIPLTLISIIPKDPHENWNLKESNWRNFIPRIPREFWGIYPVRLILTLPGALSGGILGIYYLKYLGGSPESWSIVVALTTLLGLTTIPYGKLADKLPIKKMFIFAGLGWTILYLGYYISPTPIIFAIFFIIPIWPAFWITYNKCLMELSDKTERAKFYAFEGTLSTIYGNIIGIISGYLADIFGPREMFLISSASAIIATIYINLKLKI
ncbi:MAG: MFS transporter [Candidatus Methanomethylicia archaeon]